MSTQRPAPEGELMLLMGVLDRLGIGFYRCDAEGRMLVMNASALTIYGYDGGEDWTNIAWNEDALGMRDRQRVRDQVQALGYAASFVMADRRKDGTPVYVEYSLRRLDDGDGTPAGIEGVFRDVTGEVTRFKEQQALADFMREGQERLRSFSVLQEDLLFSLSHDLKTPPVVIQGFSELLLRGRYGALSPEQEKPVQTIHRNILSLSGMVDQLLDFSRLLRTIHGTPARISLGRAWSEVCEGFGKKGHTLAAFSPCVSGGNDGVLADSNALVYTLHNLAHNVLRHARPGTQVACRCGREGRWVALTVEVPELVGDHPSPRRLLDGLFQASSAAQADAGLDGPGLAAGRYLATLMGGELTCEETPEEGMRLRLAVPAAPNP